MSRGLGGFFEGLSEGYVTGSKLKAMREQDAREARRVAIEEEGLKLRQSENERQGKESTQRLELGGFQVGKAKRDQEAEERSIASQKQLSQDSQQFLAWKNGQAPAPDWINLVLDVPKETRKAVGNQQPAPLDPSQFTESQIRMAMQRIQQKVMIDNKLFTPEMFEKQVEFSKMLEKEGIMEAFRYLEQNPNDSEGAMKIFQKNGQFKNVPKGTFLKFEVDPETQVSDIVVYTPGDNGKPMPYTSRNKLMMAYMPDKMLDYANNMGLNKFKEDRADARQGETTRAAILMNEKDNASRERAASISASSRGGGEFTAKDEVEAMNKLQNTYLTAISSDSSTAGERNQYREAANLASAYARALINEKRMDGNSAWATALAQALKEKGLAQPKPKR